MKSRSIASLLLALILCFNLFTPVALAVDTDPTAAQPEILVELPQGSDVPAAAAVSPDTQLQQDTVPQDVPDGTSAVASAAADPQPAGDDLLLSAQGADTPDPLNGVAEPDETMHFSIEMPGVGDLEELVQGISTFDLLPEGQRGPYNGSYYNQLDTDSQKAYQAIYNATKDFSTNSNDPTADLDFTNTFSGVTITKTGSNWNLTEETAKTLKAWVTASTVTPAMIALQYDHPELSWLVNVPYSFDYSCSKSNETPVSGDLYTADVTLQDLTLTISCGKNTGGKAEMDAAIATARSAIGTPDGSYETYEAIHDYLIDAIEYNHPAADDDGPYTEEQLRCYQTAYSAFYECNDDKTSLGSQSLWTVCAGYAKGFKVLCDAYGLPCVLVTGYSNGGAHAWNYVQLDGAWYAVDVTWDDRTSARPAGRNYFCAGSDTFNGTGTNQHDPQPVRMTGGSAIGLVYPELSQSAYTPAIGLPDTPTTSTPTTPLPKALLSRAPSQGSTTLWNESPLAICLNEQGPYVVCVPENEDPPYGDLTQAPGNITGIEVLDESGNSTAVIDVRWQGEQLWVNAYNAEPGDYTLKVSLDTGDTYAVALALSLNPNYYYNAAVFATNQSFSKPLSSMGGDYGILNYTGAGKDYFLMAGPGEYSGLDLSAVSSVWLYDRLDAGNVHQLDCDTNATDPSGRPAVKFTMTSRIPAGWYWLYFLDAEGEPVLNAVSVLVAHYANLSFADSRALLCNYNIQYGEARLADVPPDTQTDFYLCLEGRTAGSGTATNVQVLNIDGSVCTGMTASYDVDRQTFTVRPASYQNPNAPGPRMIKATFGNKTYYLPFVVDRTKDVLYRSITDGTEQYMRREFAVESGHPTVVYVRFDPSIGSKGHTDFGAPGIEYRVTLQQRNSNTVLATVPATSVRVVEDHQVPRGTRYEILDQPHALEITLERDELELPATGSISCALSVYATDTSDPNGYEQQIAYVYGLTLTDCRYAIGSPYTGNSYHKELTIGYSYSDCQVYDDGVPVSGTYRSVEVRMDGETAAAAHCRCTLSNDKKAFFISVAPGTTGAARVIATMEDGTSYEVPITVNPPELGSFTDLNDRESYLYTSGTTPGAHTALPCSDSGEYVFYVRHYEFQYSSFDEQSFRIGGVMLTRLNYQAMPGAPDNNAYGLPIYSVADDGSFDGGHGRLRYEFVQDDDGERVLKATLRYDRGPVYVQLCKDSNPQSSFSGPMFVIGTVMYDTRNDLTDPYMYTARGNYEMRAPAGQTTTYYLYPTNAPAELLTPVPGSVSIQGEGAPAVSIRPDNGIDIDASAASVQKGSYNITLRARNSAGVEYTLRTTVTVGLFAGLYDAAGSEFNQLSQSKIYHAEQIGNRTVLHTGGASLTFYLRGARSLLDPSGNTAVTSASIQVYSWATGRTTTVTGTLANDPEMAALLSVRQEQLVKFTLSNLKDGYIDLNSLKLNGQYLPFDDQFYVITQRVQLRHSDTLWNAGAVRYYPYSAYIPATDRLDRLAVYDRDQKVTDYTVTLSDPQNFKVTRYDDGTFCVTAKNGQSAAGTATVSFTGADGKPVSAQFKITRLDPSLGVYTDNTSAYDLVGSILLGTGATDNVFYVRGPGYNYFEDVQAQILDADGQPVDTPSLTIEQVDDPQIKKESPDDSTDTHAYKVTINAGSNAFAGSLKITGQYMEDVYPDGQTVTFLIPLQVAETVRTLRTPTETGLPLSAAQGLPLGPDVFGARAGTLQLTSVKTANAAIVKCAVEDAAAGVAMLYPVKAGTANVTLTYKNSAGETLTGVVKVTVYSNPLQSFDVTIDPADPTVQQLDINADAAKTLTLTLTPEKANEKINDVCTLDYSFDYSGNDGAPEGTLTVTHSAAAPTKLTVAGARVGEGVLVLRFPYSACRDELRIPFVVHNAPADLNTAPGVQETSRSIQMMLPRDGAAEQTLTVWYIATMPENDSLDPELEWDCNGVVTFKAVEGQSQSGCSRTITANAPGTATVTAKAKNGKTVTYNIKVVKYDGLSGLTLDLPDGVAPQKGMDDVAVILKAADGNPVSDGDYTLSVVKGPATVPENGDKTVTFTGTGAVTLKAQLNPSADPDQRALTLNVTVKPVQAAHMTLAFNGKAPAGYTVTAQSGPDTWLPAEDSATTLTSLLFAVDGSQTEAGAPQLTATCYNFGKEAYSGVVTEYTSSNADVVAVNKGTGALTVKKPGVAVITAAAKDGSGQKQTVTVRVADYTPRVLEQTVAFNAALKADGTLTLVAAEGSTLAVEDITDLKLTVEKGDPAVTIQSYDQDTHVVRLAADKAFKGKMNLTVPVKVGDSETAKEYTIEVSFNVTNTKPAPNVSVKSINLFYNDAAEALSITKLPAGATVEKVELQPADAAALDKLGGRGFTVEQDGESWLVKPNAAALAYLSTDAKPALSKIYRNYNVVITYNEYKDTSSKKYTIPATITAPRIALSPASATINIYSGVTTLPLSVTVNGEKVPVSIDLDSAMLKTTNYTASFRVTPKGPGEGPTYWQDHEVAVTKTETNDLTSLALNATVSGIKVNLAVRAENWTQPLKPVMTVTVTNKIVQPKLSAGTVTLNKNWANGGKGTVQLLVSDVSEVTFVPTVDDDGLVVEPADAATKKSDMIDFLSIGEDGVITLKPKADAAAGKTYKYKLTAHYGDELEMGAVTLSVKVVNTVPEVKLSAASVSTNVWLAAPARTVEVKPLSPADQTAYGGLDYNGFDIKLTSKPKNAADDAVTVSKPDANGKITLTPDPSAPAGNYKYTITPKLGSGATTKAQTVTLNVSAALPKAALTATTVWFNTNPQTTSRKATVWLNDMSQYGGYSDETDITVTTKSKGCTPADLSCTFDKAGGRLDITQRVPGVYTVKITPVLNNGAKLNTVTLTVNSTKTAATVTAAGKGSVDLQRRNDTQIVYTLTRKNIDVPVAPVAGESIPVRLAEGSDRFRITECTVLPNGNAQVTVKLDKSFEWPSRTKTPLSFEVTLEDGNKLTTKAVNVTPTEQKLAGKATALDGSKAIYQCLPVADRAVRYNVALTKPVLPVVQVSTAALNDTYRNAFEIYPLDNNGVPMISDANKGKINANGDFAIVLKDGAALKPGNHKLTLLAQPEGASRTGGYSFTVTVTVKA